MVYKSRAWDIAIKDSDDGSKIRFKNRIRRVLEMYYDEKKSRSDIIDETGFNEHSQSHNSKRDNVCFRRLMMIDIPDHVIRTGADIIIAAGYLQGSTAYKAAHGEIVDAVKLIEACGGKVVWDDK